MLQMQLKSKEVNLKWSLQIKMVEVKVLIEGKHDLKEGKLFLGSTVVLIKGEENILVDTGSFLDREPLINELEKKGLKPKDIDKVILTHTHLDHTTNIDLFSTSDVYCKFNSNYPGQCQKLSEGILSRVDILDDIEFSKGVKFLLTPGHSRDSISVLVKSDKGNIVIAGDAISNEEWADLEKQPKDFLVSNIDEFNKSRKKILDIADYIIPGHGGMFKVKK